MQRKNRPARLDADHQNGWGDSTAKLVGYTLAAILVWILCAGFISIIFGPISFAGIWGRVKPLVSGNLGRGVAVGVLVFVAWVLFKLRVHFRPIYGFTVMIGGACGAWLALGTREEDGLVAAGIVFSAVYVMIRGFQDLYHPIDEPRASRKNQKSDVAD